MYYKQFIILLGDETKRTESDVANQTKGSGLHHRCQRPPVYKDFGRC